MTSANVTQAASLFLDAVGAGAVSSTGNTADNGFSQVMNRTKQDMGQSTTDMGQENQKMAKTPVKVERNHVKEASEPKTEKTSDTEKSSEMENVEGESVETEVDEAVREVLTEAAKEIADAVKDELGLTDEELKAVLETLGLTQMDLLKPENMQDIVMSATGETDQMSILTDENLYQSLQTLTDAVEEAVVEVKTQLNTNDTALENILKQMEVSAESEMTEMPEMVAEAEVQSPTVVVEQNTGLRQEEVVEDVEEPILETTENTTETVDTEAADTGENQGTELTEIKRTDSESGAGKKDNSHEAESGAGKGNHENGNSFLQGTVRVNADAWNAEAVQSRAEMPFAQADVENIMNQITEYMKVETGAELTEIELQLQPETLGTLRIHLTAKEGAVTAQFTAETEAVKAVLEAQTMQLKENLNQQGVKVEAVEVTIANQGFNRSFAENGEGAANYEEPKKKGIRKIQLTEDVPIDEMELSEEDRIAAEMMEMNGNTVDYTA